MTDRYTWPHNLYRRALRLRPIVLNGDAPQAATPPRLLDLAAMLKKHARALIGQEGGRDLTAMLRVIDPRALESDSEKLAFWINLYNFLVIDAVNQLGIKQSVTAIRGFFDRVGYVVGGYVLSAHDIEQGILRANAGHPALPGPQFPRQHPLAEWAVSKLNFRIHFALNCAAESCPPLAFYDADSIEAQLDLAARSFLNSPAVAVNIAEGTVSLSKIFQWYAPDFGASSLVTFGYGDKSPILRSIAPFIADDTQRAFLENITQATNVSFQRYDWSLKRVAPSSL